MSAEHFIVGQVTRDGKNVLNERRLSELLPKQELSVVFRTPGTHGKDFTARFKVIRSLREGELQAGTKTYILDGVIADGDPISGPVAIHYYERGKFRPVLVRRR